MVEASISETTRMTSPVRRPQAASTLSAPAAPRRELLRFCVLAALGAAASYLSVNIPHTEVYFDLRMAFGFLGFALLRRWWTAGLLAAVLSLAGFHSVPLETAFVGNMLYMVPELVVVRLVEGRLLSKTRRLWLYGPAWLLLVPALYQVFHTPIIWAVMAVLRDEPIGPFVLSGWASQPYLVESVMVTIVSTAGMMVARSYGQLQTGRRELAITLESIGDGVIATDAEGRVTRMNPVAESLTGWPLHEAAGRLLAEVFRIVDGRTGELIESPAERVAREGVTVGLANHVRLVARDGTARQIADSAAPIQETDGRLIGTVMVFRDVTEEYDARERLRQKEDLLNRAEAVERAYAESVRDGRSSYEIEHRIVRRRTGEVRTVCERCRHIRNEDGELVRSVGMVQDITDERRAAREQQRLHRSLLTVLNSIDATIYVADMETYEVLFMNDHMKEAFGGDFTGRRCWEVFRGESGPCARCAGSRLLDGKGGPAGPVVWEDRNPITGRWYINFDRAIRWIDGRIVHLQVATDITERQEIEAERREYEHRIEQMRKMESIGRLAGGVAHDLNNLLTPIIGYGEMIAEDFGRDDPRRNTAEEIVGAGRRARDLVRQLLAFSRKQPLEFKVVDTNAVLQGIEKLLRRTLREDIRLSMILSSDLPAIRADVGQIEQVVMNLATNAQDAMPDGGSLTIESTVADLDEELVKSHQEVRPGSYVLLAVRDTGIGVDAETMDRIFEPFFTTKEKGKGTGLGLATVYGIVKQHGGHIWVSSEPGRGAAFECYFPVAAQGSLPEERSAETESARPGGGETVMVVEDNEAVRGLAVSVLKQHGYTVLSAADGEACLERLRGYGEPVHLLLTDVVMPSMNGRELYDRVRRMFPEIGVLYASGYTGNVIARHGVLDEGIEFIQKPFSVNELVTRVRQVLDRRPAGPAG